MSILRSGTLVLVLAIAALLAIWRLDTDAEPIGTSDSKARPSIDTGTIADNPLLAEALDPVGHPPLNRIEPAQVLPALSAALKLSRQRIQAVNQTPGPPTFTNTALALERAGQPLARASALFHALKQVQGEQAWRQLEAPVAELQSEYAGFVRSRPDLLARLDAIDQSAGAGLAPVQRRLIDVSRRRLIDHGLGLNPGDRRRFERNEQTLAELAGRFRRNLRQSTGRFELLLDHRQRLDHLPTAAVARARRDAADRGYEKAWALTLATHSRFDVFRFSPDRELRRTIYTAWRRRAGGRSFGSIGNNDEIMRRMIELRGEQAHLLGHANHWQRVLADSSVGNAARFNAIFDTILAAARPVAERELAGIAQGLRAEGHADPPRPWDWWYYRERSRSAADSLHEWFELGAVRDSAFDLAELLWGVTFTPDPDLPAWHDEVEGFVVADRDGDRLGVVYLDLLHRAGKRGGAWMSSLRPASSSGEPTVLVAANFDAASSGAPALLSPDQVETVYHELGHVLQVLFSRVDHPSLTALRVADDFIEVPALIFERFALHPDWLARRARHYRSHEALRSDQINALSARRFQLAGIETLQLLAAIAIDRAWHQAQPKTMNDPESIENELRRRFGWPPIITPRVVLGDYTELFAGQRGGRSYRRLWADVVAADAFEALTSGETFDRQTAEALRRELLAPGNRREPMASWLRFRGRAPDPVHWLRERGLVN
jgi:peptidyl-dipeptidase Dcp